VQARAHSEAEKELPRAKHVEFLFNFLLKSSVFYPEKFNLRNINSFPHDFLTPRKAFVYRHLRSQNEEMRKKSKKKFLSARARAREGTFFSLGAQQRVHCKA